MVVLIAVVAVLLVLGYGMVGLRTARKQFTADYRQYIQDFNNPTPLPKLLPRHAWLKEHANEIIHSAGCHLNYASLAEDGCNCGAGKSAYVKAMRQSKPKIVEEPKPSLGPVFIWPVIVAKSSIAKDACKIPNPKEIARLEGQLEHLT